MKVQCVLFLCCAVIQTALASEARDSSALPTSESSQSSFHMIRRQLDFSSCTAVCRQAAPVTPLNCAHAQASDNILYNCMAECARTENNSVTFFTDIGIDDPCIYGDFTCTANDMCAFAYNVSPDEDLGIEINGVDCNFTCANYIVDVAPLEGYALCESHCTTGFFTTPLNCQEGQEIENTIANCLADCGRSQSDSVAFLTSAGFEAPCISGGFTCTANEVCALYRNVSLDEDLGIMLNGTECGFTCANYIVDSLYSREGFDLCQALCGIAAGAAPMTCAEAQARDNNLFNCLAECGRTSTENDTVTFLNAVMIDDPCIYGDFTCTANDLCALARNVSLDADIGPMLNGTDCGFTCANYIVDDPPPTSSPVMPPSSTDEPTSSPIMSSSTDAPTDAPTSSPVLPSSTDAPTPSTTVPSSATRRADFNMVKMAPLLVLVISLLGY